MILETMFRPLRRPPVEPPGFRSIENPAIPLTGQNIVSYLYSGQASASGININRQSVLGLPAIWRGVNIKSDAIASLNCHVLRLSEDGKEKERDTGHPAYSLVRNQADKADFISAFTFFKTMEAQAAIEGSAYAWIIRDGAGRPRRLVILDAEQTHPIRVRENDGNTRLMYAATIIDLNGQHHDKLLHADEVLHIKGLGYSGLTSHRLVDLLKDALGIPIAAQRYGGKFFANDATPPIVIEVPYQFPDQEAANAFRKRWGERHRGLSGSHHPAILEAGAQVKTLAINNEDAQFLQTRKFEIITIANILNLPAAMLGDETKTSFASLEQEYKSLLLHSINPRLKNWEQEMWAKLLREDEKERGSHTIKFERKGFLETDLSQRTPFYAMALTHKVMTPNMVLEREDMNPVPWGDEPLPLPNESPSKAPPVGETKDADGPALEEPRTDSSPIAIEKLNEVAQDELEDRAAAMIRRLGHAVGKAAKKPQNFTTWIDEYLEADHFAVITEALTRPVHACCLLQGSTEDRTREIVEGLFADLRSDLIGVSERATYETLPQLAGELMAGYETFGVERIVESVYQKGESHAL